MTRNQSYPDIYSDLEPIGEPQPFPMHGVPQALVRDVLEDTGGEILSGKMTGIAVSNGWPRLEPGHHRPPDTLQALSRERRFRTPTVGEAAR